MLIQGWEFANAPVPTDVRYPGGALFYDDMSSWFSDASRIGSLPAYAFGFAPQVGAFTHPSTSAGIDRLYTAGGAPAWTWRLTVNDYAYECVPGVSQLAHLLPDAGAGSSAGRYDVTGMLLASIAAALWERPLWLMLPAALLPFAGLQLIPAALVFCALVVVFGGRRSMFRATLLATGLGAGWLVLWGFYAWFGTWDDFRASTTPSASSAPARLGCSRR